MNSSDRLVAGDDLDARRMPRHVAVIMDGNGRWAKKRILSRVRGHERGADTVRSIVRISRKLNIPVLTLYAFSTENWQRPQKEVNALMSLLEKFLRSEQEELKENGIRLNAIGQVQRLPDKVRRALDEAMRLTSGNRAMTLNLALSYGSRTEITEAFRNLARKTANGEIHPEEITEDHIQRELYTSGFPDPDLLIRTSGEMRLSNFLLWQVAYSEIFVTETLWPDFGPQEFVDIIRAYQLRDRRFGKVAE